MNCCPWGSDCLQTADSRAAIEGDVLIRKADKEKAFVFVNSGAHEDRLILPLLPDMGDEHVVLLE